MQRKTRIGFIVRTALIAVAAVIVIGAASVFLIPVETYRGPIEEAGAAATGRAVHLRGPIGFTLYPEIGITVSDVTFANAPGARDADMASVGRMIVGVRLIPLLSRRVEVTRLTLEKPVIHVEVDKSGKGNWIFETAKTQGAPENPQAPAQGGNASANVSLSNLRIQDGAFTYFDARTGKAEEFTGVDIAVDTTSLDQPFALKGAATYKGHKLDFTGNLGNLGAVLNQTETKASVSVASDIVKMNLDGTVGGKTTATGKFHLDVPSLRQFAGLVDVALPPSKGLNAMAMDATVVVEPQVFSASGIKIALDGMNLTGDFRMMTGGSKPALSGKLAVDRLDLNTYMAGSDAAAPSAAKASAGADAGWSDVPVNLDILKAIDADLGLTVGTLLVQKLDVEKAQIAVALKNGVLSTDLQNIGLYQGTGKGTLVVDASKPVPTFKNVLNATGLQIEPFLVAFLGVDRITGTGNVSFDVTAQGASPKAIVASLGGKGDVTFKNGMIKGVDLANVARSVQSALTGGAVGESASTDFAELGGTFTINKGVMTNTDFHLLNPFIRMTGNGTVDLANRTLDFHVEPKVAATTQGQGGQAGVAGIGIPFRISGPWTKPSYGPDLKNLGKTVTDTLLNTLKGGGQPGQPKAAIGDTLKGLFGK